MADDRAESPASARGQMTDVVLLVLADLARFLLGAAVTVINGYVLYTVLNGAFPDASKDLIIGVVSAAGTAQGVVLQFYFGSSAKDRRSG